MARAGRLATAWRQLMIEGTLIAESIRVGAELDGVRLVTRKISRSAAGDASVGQPELWTLIEFEAEEPDAGLLAAPSRRCSIGSTAGTPISARQTRRSSFIPAGSSATRAGIASGGPKPGLTAARRAFPTTSSAGRYRRAPAHPPGRTNRCICRPSGAPAPRSPGNRASPRQPCAPTWKTSTRSWASLTAPPRSPGAIGRGKP